MQTSPRARPLIVTVVVVALVVALTVAAIIIYRWVLSREPQDLPDPICVSTIGGEQAQISDEQARNASIIAGVAAQRGLPPRAVSIALATAFQESGLVNVDYGDRDSLGLFQQRPSMGWGTEEEVMDPYYSSAKFYEVMVTVQGWETADIGDVAQEVQRSGYPDAYDKHVSTARLLASALSGQTHAAWSCIVTDSADPDPDHLLTILTSAYGGTLTTHLTPATPDQSAQITITASAADTAWSAAALAQSWASQTGVTTVNIESMRWQGGSEAPAPWEQFDGQSLPAGTVVIVF